MIKAFLFDKDGIIINSEAVHIAAVADAFQSLGISIDEEDKKHIVGRHPSDYVKHFSAKYAFSVEEFRTRQRARYYELIDQAPLIPEVITLIKQLQSEGFLLAVTTSSSMETTEMTIRQARLEEVFDTVVAKGDYERSKPEPDPYLVTAERLGVSPESCIVVEDTGLGLMSAKRAGMKCIVIPNEYTKGHEFSGADLIVQDRSQLQVMVAAFLRTC